MGKNYKFLLKKLVFNKIRNIYIKINSKSKKQYLKYKGKMINIKKYKKIKTDLKNKNNKIYRKKKGGYNEKYNSLIQEKLEPFIEKIKYLHRHQILEIQEAFLDIYINIKNRHIDIKASINEHLDFLTTLLIYFEANFSNLKNIEYKSILIKIMQLLQTIEEDGITGIYSYNSEPSRNPYVMTDPRNFKTIYNVITNFKNKHKKIIWNIFVVKYELSIYNITISNTQVSGFIRYMISKKGLSDYKSDYSRNKSDYRRNKSHYSRNKSNYRRNNKIKNSRFKPY
tara:strand:+ start:30041 stop:30889 length:849 start_codon:yes stop_codon:yes gene_type:complete